MYISASEAGVSTAGPSTLLPATSTEISSAPSPTTSQSDGTQHMANGHSTVFVAVTLSVFAFCVVFSLGGVWYLKRRYPDPFAAARKNRTGSVSQTTSTNVNNGPHTDSNAAPRKTP